MRRIQKGGIITKKKTSEGYPIWWFKKQYITSVMYNTGRRYTDKRGQKHSEYARVDDNAPLTTFEANQIKGQFRYMNKLAQFAINHNITDYKVARQELATATRRHKHNEMLFKRGKITEEEYDRRIKHNSP
jgi:hypothetical protein